jgi:hypothetical protein
MPFSQGLPGGSEGIPCLFKFSSHIREGLGNKIRVENNWVRYLNPLIWETESLEKEPSLFNLRERSVMKKGT